MGNFGRCGWLSAGFWLALGLPALALPGQTATQVEAWIQGNATLRPRPGEQLVVHRTDTAARRFTFQASVFPPTGVQGVPLLGKIRSEHFLLVDIIDGVSMTRLEESLRRIYGADVYSDYERAERVMVYPTAETPPYTNRYLVIQGELLVGDRFGYWVEMTSDTRGRIETGRVTLLLREDVAALGDFLRGAPL
ncbi:MAG: hypothetical protein AAF215_04605 [Cyanobacteria bacterium P01_A01_bin.123]